MSYSQTRTLTFYHESTTFFADLHFEEKEEGGWVLTRNAFPRQKEARKQLLAESPDWAKPAIREYLKRRTAYLNTDMKKRQKEHTEVVRVMEEELTELKELLGE